MGLIRAGYVDQARCALTVVRALLDRLRTLDLYDRSAIVVTSDHGMGLFPPRDAPPGRERVPSGKSLRRMKPEATPLLLIKPFGAQGPLQLSNAPTSIVDLPATLLDLAGLPNTLVRFSVSESCSGKRVAAPGRSRSTPCSAQPDEPGTVGTGAFAARIGAVDPVDDAPAENSQRERVVACIAQVGGRESAAAAWFTCTVAREPRVKSGLNRRLAASTPGR